MTSSLDNPQAQQALREFCAAVYGAQCLVAAGEYGPRVSMLMRYASTLLDAIDVQLLESRVAPDDPGLAALGRLREDYERLVLALLSVSLRQRAAGASRAATSTKLPAPRRLRSRPAPPENESPAPA